MKRLIAFIILLTFLSVLPVHADNHSFYSFGRWYDPPTIISGEIISVSGTGEGKAGIEQNTIIETDKGQLDIEITSWYKGIEYYRDCPYPYDCPWTTRPYYDVGLVVWLEGKPIPIFARYQRAAAGKFYTYNVQLYTTYIEVTISDESGKIIISRVIDGFQRLKVKNVSGYLEYYDYGTPFYYYGYVTLDGLNYNREDHVRDFAHFKAYILQRNWDNKIYFKGEIHSKL